MSELHQLKSMLMDELKEYGMKKELSAGSLDTIDKLSHSIKCIDKIMECHAEEVIVEEKDETEEVIDYLQRAIVAMRK